MERGLEIEVQVDGTVATLLHKDDATVVVMDTDTEWRAQVGNNPVLILARMLQSQEGWAKSLEVPSRLPKPGVLTVLEAFQ